MTVGVLLNRGDLMGAGEHAHKADDEITEEKETIKGETQVLAFLYLA